MPNNNNIKKQVSLSYLFVTFFQIGLFSFGGNMSLISMVQKKLVDEDNVIDNSQLLDAISIAALLPGPMAVNVVASVGYYLGGKRGAALSMFGVLLTAIILMLILSWLYYFSSAKIFISDVMKYVSGAVCAIILSVGASLYKKEIIGDYRRVVISLLAAAGLFFFSNYVVFLLFIVGAGFLGVLLRLGQNTEAYASVANTDIKLPSRIIWPVVLFLASVQMLFSTGWYKQIASVNIKIVLVFCGLSLTLFGGGYVMIPAMQSLFVNDLQWLSQKEFVDAIAFSQLTPGPIMVSSVFIGFKMSGFVGAFLAAAAMFVPPAFIMILLSRYLNNNRNRIWFNSAMTGIKSVVIVMIIVAALKSFPFSNINVPVVSVFLIGFILNYFYNVNPSYIILGSLLVSGISLFLT